MSTTNNSVNNQIGSASNNTLLSHIRSASGQWDSYFDQTDTFGFYSGVGSPEGVVLADTGSYYTDTGAGATGIYYKQTDAANTGWIIVAGGAVASNIQVFTSNGTYTPSAGVVFAVAEVLGGGGGSGGTGITVAGQLACAGGGGGGEYRKGVLSAATIGASQAVTIGAAGAAAALGANPGGAGGNTSLGALLIANGGGGGAGSATGVNVSVAGGASGTGGLGGQVIIPGQAGQIGQGSFTAGNFFPGAGGSSIKGFGGQGRGDNIVTNQIGLTGQGFGPGASGSWATTTQPAQVGAAGTAGIIIITEYTVSGAGAPIPITQSWTPTLEFGGASVGITYATQLGFYQQVGNIVYYTWFMTLSSKGTSVGTAAITGLPVAAASTGATSMQSGVMFFTNFVFTVGKETLVSVNLQSGTELQLAQYGTATTFTAAADTNFVNATGLGGSGFYFTD